VKGIGQVQDVIVRKLNDADSIKNYKYGLVAGSLRFFAKALGLTSNEVMTTHNNRVQKLSKEVPSSPATIERRLSLLSFADSVKGIGQVQETP